MLCKRCGYSLMGIDSRTCPECGHAFNPGDPTTFDSAGQEFSPALHRWFRLIAVASALAPLANILASVLCWIAAWIALGHPPRPSADDPNQIPEIRALYHWWATTANPSCISILVGIGVALALTVLRGSRRQRRHSLLLAVAVFGVWFAFFGCLLSIGNWLMD
jgi:hypothetical protein